jgi:hypothetical protein
MAIIKPAVLAAAAILLTPAQCFSPPATQLSHIVQFRQTAQFMTPDIIDAFTSTTQQSISSLQTTPSELLSSSSTLLSFSDQGQNLAGTFFQLSLLPYLLFLYFLSFRANRIPDLANFGFAYLLLFVLGTIPSGIVTKSVYGETLANVDWLHGGAEALLTVTNVLIVSIDVILSCIFLFQMLN